MLGGPHHRYWRVISEDEAMPYKIMIMGASYGSLLASKILFGATRFI